MVSELQKGEAGVGRDNKTQGESDKINGERALSGEMKQERKEEGEIDVAVSVSEPERTEGR